MAIREIVRNEEYAQAIKKRIGVQIDTKAVDKELEGYQVKLKEVDLNKTRLEREIDGEKITDMAYTISFDDSVVLQAGKRKFAKLVK